MAVGIISKGTFKCIGILYPKACSNGRVDLKNNFQMVAKLQVRCGSIESGKEISS
jgi:hypothetical protein